MKNVNAHNRVGVLRQGLISMSIEQRSSHRDPKPKILLVSDDPKTSAELEGYLEQEGMSVSVAYDGPSGLLKAQSDAIDVIMLARDMWQVSGLQFIEHLRQRQNTPVLVIDGRDDDVDCIVCLELGADDYLAKSRHPREMMARLRAILRRMDATTQKKSTASSTVRVNELELDGKRRVARFAGAPLSLTDCEFNILFALAKCAGSVVSKTDLMQAALGRNDGGSGRCVDTHISRLRKKLDAQPGVATRIKTVFKRGYQYVP